MKRRKKINLPSKDDPMMGISFREMVWLSRFIGGWEGFDKLKRGDLLIINKCDRYVPPIQLEEEYLSGANTPERRFMCNEIEGPRFQDEDEEEIGKVVAMFPAPIPPEPPPDNVVPLEDDIPVV
ncbi:MAG: hypothetical protein WC822_03950 [Candidatus Paceibacterota bacterium]|jgi:hypothetical protein